MPPELKGQQITLQGKDFQNGSFVDSEVKISICDDSQLTGFSRPITQDAKREMINSFIDELQNKLKAVDAQSVEYKGIMNQTVSVDFGKESLLLLLSQPGCEGIKFSFAKGINTQYTLVAEGLTIGTNGVQPVIIPDVTDKSGNVIKNEPMTFEVVPPYTLEDWVKEKDSEQFQGVHKVLFI